jgi:energy-coupling factor transporter ATP-binding protein EcfA2
MKAQLMVEAAPWEDFAPWFHEHWEQGEHVVLIGPTGFGKTTVKAHLLKDRLPPLALALDVKGGDTTLAKLQRYGFVRSGWPLDKKVYRDIQKGMPARFIIGHRPRTMEDISKHRLMMQGCLHDMFSEGGWTGDIDETQMAADRRIMNLSGILELNLIAARDRGVSLINNFQRPANVPRSASEMASHVFIFPTRDQDTVDRLAQIMGRPKEEVRGALRGLGGKIDHMVLYVSSDPFAPMLVTRAPRI